MNANELADELCFAEMDSDEIETWAKEARDMLRQQANRMAKLEKQLKTQKIGNALIKAIANFPVATPAKTLTDEFIYKNHVGYLSPNNDFYAPDYPTWKQDGFTPIYKEPVAKTLTDAEIWDLINAFCTDMGDYWDLNEKNAIPMIKAILRKAQEK